MATVEGLRVLIEGDLPDEVLTRVSEAVRQAVLAEVAELDLAPTLREVPLEPSDFDAGASPGEQPAADEANVPIELIPILLGIWFKQETEL